MKTKQLVKAKLQGTTILGRVFGANPGQKQQRWVVPVAIVGVGIAAVTIIGMLYLNYQGLATLGASSGEPDLALYTGVLAGWAFVFLFGFPIAFSVLLFSKDTRLLISLPLHPFQVVLANVSVLYLYALPVAVVLFVPAIVASAPVILGGSIGLPSTLAFWVSSVVVTLLLPVLPVTLAVIFVTIVGRLFNVSRFRVAFETIGMLVGVFGLIALQLVLSRSLSLGETGDLTQQLESFASGLKEAFPPASLYSEAFLSGEWFALLGGVVGSVAAFLLAIWVVQMGFVRQITEQGSVHRPKHYTPDATLPPPLKPSRALIGRELRLLTSNSTFLFESAGELVIFPILLVVFRISMPADQLDQIMPFLNQTAYLFPIVLVLLLLLSGINSITSAAISREGKLFNLSLVLPLRGSVQIGAKLKTYLLLFGGSLTINAVLAVWILSQPWWWVPLLVVLALPYLVFIGGITLFADLRRPLLSWSHPQQAVKQNVNVILGMGATIVGIALISLPALAGVWFGLRQEIVVLLGAGIAAIAGPLVVRSVFRYADTRYASSFDSGPVQGVRT